MLKPLLKYLLSAALFISVGLLFPKTETILTGAYKTSSLISLINTERRNNNLSSFIYSPRLTSAAYNRAVNLYSNSQWSHNGFQDAVDEVAKQNVLYGENLAINILSDTNLFTSWMASPTHKANILNSNFKYVGFARYSNYAVIWFSQEY